MSSSEKFKVSVLKIPRFAVAQLDALTPDQILNRFDHAMQPGRLLLHSRLLCDHRA